MIPTAEDRINHLLRKAKEQKNKVNLYRPGYVGRRLGLSGIYGRNEKE